MAGFRNVKLLYVVLVLTTAGLVVIWNASSPNDKVHDVLADIIFTTSAKPATGVTKKTLSEAPSDASTSPEKQPETPDADESMENDVTYRRALEPDDWQTVVTHESYVYAAHLDWKSGEFVSLIRVIGSLGEKEYNDLKNHHFYCVLRTWIDTNKKPEIHVTMARGIRKMAHLQR